MKYQIVKKLNMSQNENKTHTHKFLSQKRGYVWEIGCMV